MRGNEKCPFCKGNRDQSRVIYENNHVFLLLDLFPVRKGHLLVIPQEHRKDINELDKKTKLEIFKAADLSKKVLKDVFNAKGFNLGFNIGENAGQTVEHIHLHVIPRYDEDESNSRGGIRKATIKHPKNNLKQEWKKNRISNNKRDKIIREINKKYE